MSLPDHEFINAGTQLEYGRLTPHTREGFLQPTHTFDGEQEDRVIAGVAMRFIHTPGEADENISVWLPDAKVLIAGDVILKTFPNIAPLRGLPARPVEKWIASLDRLVGLEPEALVPGHMSVILDAGEARDALTAYRDAISVVREATMEGIAQSKTPDELVQQIRLPEHLAAHPYLQEFYGTIAWTVRGIFHQKAGGFDGNPTRIFPLTDRESAEKRAEMIGGARSAGIRRGFEWRAR